MLIQSTAWSLSTRSQASEAAVVSQFNELKSPDSLNRIAEMKMYWTNFLRLGSPALSVNDSYANLKTQYIQLSRIGLNVTLTKLKQVVWQDEVQRNEIPEFLIWLQAQILNWYQTSDFSSLSEEERGVLIMMMNPVSQLNARTSFEVIQQAMESLRPNKEREPTLFVIYIRTLMECLVHNQVSVMGKDVSKTYAVLKEQIKGMEAQTEKAFEVTKKTPVSHLNPEKLFLLSPLPEALHEIIRADHTSTVDIALIDKAIVSFTQKPLMDPVLLLRYKDLSLLWVLYNDEDSDTFLKDTKQLIKTYQDDLQNLHGVAVSPGVPIKIMEFQQKCDKSKFKDVDQFLDKIFLQITGSAFF